MRSRRAAAAALLTAGLVPAFLPAVQPPSIPPVGTAAEDDYPRTEAERARALRHLEAVARCVRARGLSIPDPVSNAEGVTLGWDGPAPPEVDPALRACHEEALSRR